MHKRIVLPALVGVMFLGACSGRQAPQVDPAIAAEEARLAEEEARRRAEEEARRRAAEEEANRRAEEERRAREAAAAEAARAREIMQVMVHFDYDRYTIRSDAEEALMAKVAVLRANPTVRVRIEGHADERGSDEYNLALGLRRANAVRDFFVSYGLDESRFETVSFGEDRPLVRASNEEAWARNRRAEFVVTAGQLTRAPQR